MSGSLFIADEVIQLREAVGAQPRMSSGGRLNGKSDLGQVGQLFSLQFLHLWDGRHCPTTCRDVLRIEQDNIYLKCLLSTLWFGAKNLQSVYHMFNSGAEGQTWSAGRSRRATLQWSYRRISCIWEDRWTPSGLSAIAFWRLEIWEDRLVVPCVYEVHRSSIAA